MQSLNIKKSDIYDDFYEIPDYPNYVLNKQGVVLNKNTGKIVKSYIPTNKKTYFVFIGINNKKLAINLSRLMAKIFLELPKECNGNTYLAMVNFKDGNSKNINLDNLEWITRSKYQKNSWDSKNKINYKRFHLSKDFNLGFYPDKISCCYYKNCYQFPSKTDFISINENGEVYRFPNKNPISIFINAKGYPSFSYIDENGRRPMLLHRALAMLFIPIPEKHKNKKFSELEVNHIDGVKTNFSLNNLEWVTTQENMDHAHSIGLIISKRAVLARNIITNEIIKYDSINSCRKAHKLDKHMLRTHLTKSSAGKIIYNNFVFKFDNELPWPTMLATPTKTLDLWKTVNVVAENTLTNKKFIFSTMVEAANYFNISKAELTNHRNRKGHLVPLNNLIFYKLEDTF